MPFNTTILYPATPSLTFDMSYYQSHHFPLVEQYWRSYGLLDWQVIIFITGAGGSDPPYKYAGIIEWKDKESFERLTKSGEPWKVVMDDVPNFSSETPTLMMGDVVSSG